ENAIHIVVEDVPLQSRVGDWYPSEPIISSREARKDHTLPTLDRTAGWTRRIERCLRTNKGEKAAWGAYRSIRRVEIGHPINKATGFKSDPGPCQLVKGECRRRERVAVYPDQIHTSFVDNRGVANAVSSQPNVNRAWSGILEAYRDRVRVCAPCHRRQHSNDSSTSRD